MNVKYHSTRPWHLRCIESSSAERKLPRRKAVAFIKFHRSEPELVVNVKYHGARPWHGRYTGVAVFLFGLKNGVFTTVAPTSCRTASTVISKRKRVPTLAYSRLTVARAIIFFNVGDQVVVVAFPI